MAEIVRHGDRWAVIENPGESPIAEYPTREQAELAAGPDAVVREDDPTGLDEVQDRDVTEQRAGGTHAAGGPPGDDTDPGGGAQPGETARDRQAGL